MAQQRGRMVEDYEIDQIAADGAGHRRNESKIRVLERSRTVGAGVVDEDRHVDVALRTRYARDSAPEQPGEAHGRLRAQAARKVVAQPVERGIAAGFGRTHQGTNLAETASEARFSKERLAYRRRLVHNSQLAAHALRSKRML